MAVEWTHISEATEPVDWFEWVQSRENDPEAAAGRARFEEFYQRVLAERGRGGTPTEDLREAQDHHG